MFDPNERTGARVDPRQIQHGWDVFDANGDKVGDVSQVNDGYLTVSKGWLFPTERYIPFSAISGIEHDRVYLNVTKDEIDARGWDQPPTGDVLRTEETTAMPTEPAPGIPRAGMTTEGRPVEGERTIPLREEQLRAHKEMAQTGEVDIHKEVVTERQTMQVPVSREEVVVERHDVPDRPADRPIGEGGDETIRIPVREERVEVEKRPVVYEEVEVGKRQVQETQPVSADLRREEVKVERQGDVDVRTGPGLTGAGQRTWDEAMPTYRQRWQQQYGTTGGRWEDFEPGYRYGYEMASGPRYQGRQWTEVEPTMRADYEDWARRHNYQVEPNTWDRVKNDAHQAWEDVRQKVSR